MRITVMGMALFVIVGMLLLALVGYALEQWSSTTGKSDDQPNCPTT